MELTIYAPGLLLPEAVLTDSVFDLQADALSLLLGRGQCRHPDADWLAEAFGLKAPLPAAALRNVGAGTTAGTAPSGQWLCLDPVHWQVSREGVNLAAVALDADEAAELIAAVQPIFAAWGNISSTSPQHWHLHLTRSLLLDTRPLPESLGQPVDPNLPAGLDGPEWRRLIAEAQTVLHAHPVNRRREADNRPAINSLWPWGMGALPAMIDTEFEAVWSSDPLLAGLAAHAGIPCLAPPPKFQPAAGSILHHFDGLAEPARNLNALTWRLALLTLDEHWIAPAITALRNGECSALRLVGTCLQGTPRTAVFSMVRANLWRFWRRPAPLTDLA